MPDKLAQEELMLCRSIPTCYFPSTVLFLAHTDVPWLAGLLSCRLTLSYHVASTEAEVFQRLQSQRVDTDGLSQHCAQHHVQIQEHPFLFDSTDTSLAVMHAEIYNPERFAEISVLVVDDAQEGWMTCCTAKRPYLKKIVLIEPEKESVAKQALQEGWIDFYLKKDDQKLIESLQQAIHRLQHDYFLVMSRLTMKIMQVETPPRLHDPVFVDFFQKLCTQHKIVEYYLMDLQGSFFMLTATGKKSCLMVKRDDDMAYVTEKQCYNDSLQAIHSYRMYLDELEAEAFLSAI